MNISFRRAPSIGALGVAMLGTMAVSILLSPKAAAHERKDILHLSSQTRFTNAGLETNATGHVDARENKDGHEDNQKLSVKVRGLGTNAPYMFLSMSDGDTNLTQVMQFSTDDDGDV